MVMNLGTTGRNLGAGMSGGIAYIYDEWGDFVQNRLNQIWSTFINNRVWRRRDRPSQSETQEALCSPTRLEARRKHPH